MDYINQSMESPETELPEIVVPSISSSARRVELSMGQPTMRKLDKRATRDVIAHNNAKTGSANVNKKLISSAALDEIKTLINTVRSYHADNTVPWGESGGSRLIANANYIEYKNQIDDYEVQFWALAERCVDAYPSAVADAQLQLGDMFDERDYPSVDKFKSKFKFKCIPEPIPEVGDFRIDIGNQAEVAMREQYKKALEDRVNVIKQDLAKRLAEPLKRMSKGLDYIEGEKPTGFRDTLVDNVLTIVDLMRTCNVGNDPSITTMQAQLRQTLTGVTPDGLRHSSILRAKTKQNVDAIIKKLPSLGF